MPLPYSRSHPFVLVYSLAVLVAFPILLSSGSLAGAMEEINMGKPEVWAKVASGDTLQMLSRLDSLLKTTKEKEQLYLLRGDIHLARGEGEKGARRFPARRRFPRQTGAPVMPGWDKAAPSESCSAISAAPHWRAQGVGN